MGIINDIFLGKQMVVHHHLMIQGKKYRADRRQVKSLWPCGPKEWQDMGRGEVYNGQRGDVFWKVVLTEAIKAYEINVMKVK